MHSCRGPRHAHSGPDQPLPCGARGAHEDEFHHEAALRGHVDAGGVADIEVGEAHHARRSADRKLLRLVGVRQPAVQVGAGNDVRRPQFLRRVLWVVHDAQEADVVLARAPERRVGVLVAVGGQLGGVGASRQILLRLDVAVAVRMLQVAGTEQGEQGAVHLGRLQHVAHLGDQRKDVVARVVGAGNRLGQLVADGPMQLLRHGRLQHQKTVGDESMHLFGGERDRLRSCGGYHDATVAPTGGARQYPVGAVQCGRRGCYARAP